MGPEALAQVLRPLMGMFPAADYPDLLVGLEGPDDAAVYRLDDARALVVTTDFFPPVVDDPYSFGAIAAANAMSDVFAMGGTVLLALNLLGVPEDLPTEVVTAILRGGAETVRAGGGVIAGGHSIIDAEPKYVWRWLVSWIPAPFCASPARDRAMPWCSPRPWAPGW